MKSRLAVEVCAVSLFTLGLPAMAGAQAPIAAPVLKPPPKILSLHRPQEGWKVVTTVDLAIQPTTVPAVGRTFRWTKPVHGEFTCEGEESATPRQVKTAAGVSSVRCTYQPEVGFHDVDTFKYDAAFEGGPFAEQAEVTIEVRDRGFRWEFKTAGSTVTSDKPEPQALRQIPSIIGGTSQDFLFTVNWQTMRPKRVLMEPARARDTRLLGLRDLILKDNMASQTANFLVETGVQTEAVAATVADVGASATTAPPPPGTGTGTGTGAAATTPAEAVARRNMVLRGEFNYNAGFNVDGAGRFVEVGAVGKGSFSTVLDSDESFKEALGRVLQIVPKDRAAYKADVGVRFAVKQAHETETTTIVNPDGQTERPTNIENMILVEAMLRFDTSQSGLTTDKVDGDSRKRWAVRAEFSPEITLLPGHQLPTVGFEVSKAFDGGSPAVKVTYGMNLSATKGIFK
jgi:hypothetical protein